MTVRVKLIDRPPDRELLTAQSQIGKPQWYVSWPFVPIIFGGSLIVFYFNAGYRCSLQPPMMIGFLGFALFGFGVVGFISALLGLGGGNILVQLLRFYNLPMRLSVGTSSVCSCIVASSG